MILRDRMLSPVSMVTKEKELQRQSGITDESFRNAIEPFCSVPLKPWCYWGHAAENFTLEGWKWFHSWDFPNPFLLHWSCPFRAGILESRKKQYELWQWRTQFCGNILMPVTVVQVWRVIRAHMDKNNTEIVREKISWKHFSWRYGPKPKLKLLGSQKSEFYCEIF